MARPAEDYFIHSRCCGTHWVLLNFDSKTDLQCQDCGKSTGGLKVVATGFDSGFGMSRCCKANWELVFTSKKKYEARCEKCGKMEKSIVITGPDLSHRGCDECDHE